MSTAFRFPNAFFPEKKKKQLNQGASIGEADKNEHQQTIQCMLPANLSQAC
jgi:hypothetical protein